MKFILRFLKTVLKQSHHKMCFFTGSNHKVCLFFILQIFVSEYDIRTQINTLPACCLCLTVLCICLIFIHFYIAQSKIHMCFQIPFYFYLYLTACLQCFFHTYCVFFFLFKQKNKIIFCSCCIIIAQNMNSKIIKNFLKNIDACKFLYPFISCMDFIFSNNFSPYTHNIFLYCQIQRFCLLFYNSFSLDSSIQKISRKFGSQLRN